MLVIDTNVLVYLLIAGDRTQSAQILYAADDDWHTESFALVELSNVLATACRTRGLAQVRAARVLESAEQLLRDRLHTVAHAAALSLAASLSISAYDARFLALAQQLGSPLVTEDVRLRMVAPDWTRSIAEAAGGGLRGEPA
jgi:predicted nucleic acid-binding protein